MSKPSDAELIATIEAFQRFDCNRAATARHLGMSPSGVGDRLEAAKRRGLRVPDREPLAHRDRIEHAVHPPGAAGGAVAGAQQAPSITRHAVRAEDELRSLRRALKEAHRDDLASDRVRQFAFGLGAAEHGEVEWLVKVREAMKGSKPGVPMTFWSDWHFGGVVRPEQVDGLNEFNTEIAENRVRRLVEKTLDLTLSHMVNPSYPGIVVGLGGDMFQGTIHDELVETNDKAILESIVHLSDVIVHALEAVAKEYPNVLVPCVTGNHDRISRRPAFANAVVNSYAWMLYNIVERRLKDRGVKNVVVRVSDSFDARLRVYGLDYTFTHGDRLGVKGGDGFIGAIGPIKRGELRLKQQQARVGRETSVLVMGHWHQYMALRHLIVNGSLIGYDAYASGNRFQYEPPCQALWFSHPKYGITCNWPVYVEDDIKPKSLEWASVPA